MAQGSIRKRQLDDSSVRYDVVVDLGIDQVTGKRRQRKKTFRTKREAQSGLTNWLAEIEKGLAVDRSRQTVGELMHYWLETYARHNVRAKTFEDYERTIRVHIVPALDRVSVQKLTPVQLQKFYSDKLASGCGERTVEQCHQRISQALEQALKMGLVARNVADAVTPPRVERKEMQTWTEEQAQRFLERAKQSPYGPIWIVLLLTGMRRGEGLGLRWRDVDSEGQVLRVRQTVTVVQGAPHIGPPKNKSSVRDVSVHASVMAALHEHKARQNERRLQLGDVWQDNDLVFPSAVGTPINPNNLTRDYNRCVAQAGVPRIRIHDQRHTHASQLLQMGIDIKVVAERLGHARTSTTMDIYHHVTAKQHRDAGDKIGAAFLGAYHGRP